MTTKYDELMSDPEFRKMMAVETLVASASEEIARLMNAQKLTKADVARRLGKSRAWVTQLLNGSANMTVRTLAEVTFALGGEVKLQIQPQTSVAESTQKGQWREISTGGPAQMYRLEADRTRFRPADELPQPPSSDAEEYAA
jgi:transcriptional regulator with XRE-family HTH domain